MDLESIKNHRNSHNPFAKRLGIEIEELTLGFARAVKTVTQEDLNPVCVPHGGIYFSLADTACGSAVASHGRKVVTLSAGYNFLRSADVGDTITAEAREIKNGKTICVCDVRITNQNSQLLGTGTFTFYVLEETY